MDDAILSALFNRGEHNVIQLTNELKLFLVFFPAMPMPSRGLEIDWFGISIKKTKHNPSENSNNIPMKRIKLPVVENALGNLKEVDWLAVA